MIQRFRFDIIVRFLLGFPRWMGENPFLGFLILLSIALLMSSLVFYQYVFVARDADIKNEIVQIRFDQQAFQELLGTWQKRKEKFNQADVLEVKNIFAPSQRSKELTE